MPDLTIASLLKDVKGISPDGKREATFSVSTDFLWGLVNSGNQSVLDEAWFIPDVCAKPAGIWEGLKRAGTEAAYCYAGVPSLEFSKEHYMDGAGFQNKRTFTIFCVADPTTSDKLIVAKWRWSEMCPERRGFPLDHETRFGRLLWQAST